MCRPHGDNNISELGNFVSSLPKGFVSIARYTPRHSPAQSYEFLKFRENMIISREIFLSLQHLAICHFPSPKTLNESALTRYLQSLEKRNHLNDPASGANHGISSPTRTARTTRSSCFFLILFARWSRFVFDNCHCLWQVPGVRKQIGYSIQHLHTGTESVDIQCLGFSPLTLSIFIKGVGGGDSAGYYRDAY